MIQRILLTMALLVFLGSLTAFGQATPEVVHQKVSKTIAKEETTYKNADQWNWDKKELIDEIRNTNVRVAYLQYQKEKYGIYIKGVKQTIENLEFQKTEILRLREQLSPYLDEVVDRLAAFVENDLPFLPEERQTRLKRLRDGLNNYEVAMSEKLRRVFAEGLEIETQYGEKPEAIDTTLNLNGSETQVVILRLGRVALLYMSLDGTQVGRWNPDTHQWEPLPEKLTRTVSRAIDIAQGKRVVEIVEIPLGAL